VLQTDQSPILSDQAMKTRSRLHSNIATYSQLNLVFRHRKCHNTTCYKDAISQNQQNIVINTSLYHASDGYGNSPEQEQISKTIEDSPKLRKQDSQRRRIFVIFLSLLGHGIDVECTPS
jgi:hypothetical protein